MSLQVQVSHCDDVMSRHQSTTCRCRGEPTTNYMKLILAPEMGQEIMPNTVTESRGISFLKLREKHVMKKTEKEVPQRNAEQYTM